MMGIYDDVLEIPASSVVPAHRASDDLVVFFRDEAEPGIAFEVASGGLFGVRFANAHAWSFAHEGENVIVMFNREFSDRHAGEREKSGGMLLAGSANLAVTMQLRNHETHERHENGVGYQVMNTEVPTEHTEVGRGGRRRGTTKYTKKAWSLGSVFVCFVYFVVKTV